MNTHLNHGFVPEFLLFRLAKMNPDSALFRNALLETRNLQLLRQLDPHGPYLRFLGAGRGEREVSDAKGKSRIPGDRGRFEGDPVTGIADVDNCYDYAGAVRDYYLQVHGRNSIDANGMKLLLTVRYPMNNAYWDSTRMVFGTGDGKIFKTFLTLNVTAHELTHGVTEHASGLIYHGMPGALNESHSDIGGANVEAWFLKKNSLDYHWVVGDGIFMPGIKGRGLRDMLNPGTAYDDRQLGKDPQPAHLSKYKRMYGDNGGVHINSGIPNKAYAEFARAVCEFALANGGPGEFPWEVAGKIWYAARPPAKSKASFYQFAHHTVVACQTLFPTHEERLREAWDKVGVTPDAKKGDDLTPFAPGEELTDENEFQREFFLG